MRYELADYEWAAIRLMLPNKPRGDQPPQFGEGTTRIFAIMPPSSCSRMWQW